jgi:biotin transport system substrate-specific component
LPGYGGLRPDEQYFAFNGEDMLATATIADLLRPYERRRAVFYDIVLVIGGSLLIGLCARIKVLLPFSPVPITGQTFAVLMIGALLGPWRGSLAVLAYIIEGAAGLPVFALGGGFTILIGPTGGYLVGFVPAAYITGLLALKGWDRRIGTTVLAMVLGNIVIYAFGLFWLCCLTGINRAVLSVGLYPFIVGDLLKIALAAAVLPAGWKLLEYSSIT